MKNMEFDKEVNEKFSELQKTQKKPNILIIGGTGVGKSSLINSCFGSQIAKEGTGKPVTAELEKYQSEEFPLVLFDTKGYEVGSSREEEFLSAVVNYAINSLTESDPIHLVWYCIQGSSGRITDFDIDTIKKLQASKIPVSIVITKAEFLSEEESIKFTEAIRSCLPGINVFETSTKDKKNKWGFSELFQWSVDNLPAALQVAFVAAQARDMEMKKTTAYKIIKQHTAGSVGFVFSPIPFSDAPLLLANQAGMVVRILYVYNLQSLSEDLTGSLIATAIGTAVSRSGIWAAGELIKLFPGFGTVAGSFINASVASSITFAIGASVVAMCENIILNDFDAKSISGQAKDFTSFFEKQFEKFSTQTSNK